jgi:simple sugar transport system permease protein
MMLMGALSGFAVTYFSHSLFLGVLTSLAMGGMLALIHGFFTISLRANQVVCGLALTILGIGLSSFLGRSIIGRVGQRFVPFPIPLLREIPVLGPILFNQTPLIYLSYLLVPSAWFFLYQTRPGLNLRSVGENPAAADTAGIPVTKLRYLWTIFGGMLAGLGGAYLSLSYTPGWKENMTSGQGWIAIARSSSLSGIPGEPLLSIALGGINASILFRGSTDHGHSFLHFENASLSFHHCHPGHRDPMEGRSKAGRCPGQLRSSVPAGG